uniref:Pyridoxine 5'-phosphate synthase n=1 Tax=Candidatus Aschnera chinzeii TaxID=1485666 RepID=A0AAT9G3V7_9ENTR|nr:MAG: pyridoxine 5'-phosphate synthase [Candidatus Aschnera chinzeii]
MKKILLGVNIDHVATLRNMRGTQYPDPIQAAFIAENSGVDNITVHLREDRRHITERDVRILQEVLRVHMNLEMSINDEIVNLACDIKPTFCCLVPEQRKEHTTERGLNLIKDISKISSAVNTLSSAGIIVSLFIDPDHNQIDIAANIPVTCIEIHTGYYANAKTIYEKEKELQRIQYAAVYAANKKLKVNAGHGLDYHNVQKIAKIPEIDELNIGHSIISRSIFSGIECAIKDMKKILYEARS